MTVVAALGVGLALCSVGMLALFLYARRTSNVGWVDVGWTVGIGLVVLLGCVISDGAVARRAIVAALAAIWAGRLALHLVQRVAHEPEDGRYQTLRGSLPPERVNTFFFWFFQAQALLIVLFAAPPLVAASASRSALDLWDLAGVVIFVVAVLGEAAADRQLAAFRANPANRGKTCRAGLWRYSRHPNYFFEWLHWFAYIPIGVGAAAWWVTWLGPVVMLAFLYRVTGIPWTEMQALRSRGEDYRQYQRTTSAFIPWFPRESTL